MNNRKNLLNISDLKDADVESIAQLANQYLRKEAKNCHLLKNKIVINLFFENSTRTLVSFEVAAKNLGANVVTLPIKSSSLLKGEDIKDMIRTLSAIGPSYMIIRHGSSGFINKLANHTNCSLINAGDGRSEHPTQALADYLVIINHKKQIKNLKIVICGDILHSRVARSNIRLLKMLGAKISLVAPPTMLCKHFCEVDSFHYSLIEGIKNADVIMLLRLQRERMSSSFSEREYFHLYGLDAQKLSYAKPDAIVMHAGPINRGIEISNDIEDCVILQQVKFGLATRKAVLHYLLSAS